MIVVCSGADLNGPFYFHPFPHAFQVVVKIVTRYVHLVLNIEYKLVANKSVSRRRLRKTKVSNLPTKARVGQVVFRLLTLGHPLKTK
jgi:hypothetical protein